MPKRRLHYDAVVKDLFQRDRPTLLGMFAGPVEVCEFLNLELPAVEERFADLLILLSDDSLLHFEFQSSNDRWMAHRVGGYGLAAARKYGKSRVRQVVIYIGAGPMKMPDSLDLGGIQISYDLVDLREFDAEVFLRSGNPGDLALALLAGDGMEKWPEILAMSAALPEPQRRRVMTQMLVFSGLRPMPEQFKLEMETMRTNYDIEKHPLLGPMYLEVKAKGRAEGLAEGEASAKIRMLHAQLEAKFGKPIPAWASKRIKAAQSSELDRWLLAILKADTLEGVIGQRVVAARKR